MHFHAISLVTVIHLVNQPNCNMYTLRKKKVLPSTFFWCFVLSQIEDSSQYLEGPNSIWKDCERNIRSICKFLKIFSWTLPRSGIWLIKGLEVYDVKTQTDHKSEGIHREAHKSYVKTVKSAKDTWRLIHMGNNCKNASVKSYNSWIKIIRCKKKIDKKEKIIFICCAKHNGFCIDGES